MTQGAWTGRCARAMRRGIDTAACDGEENLFPKILDCARSYCTLYEIRHAMEEVFGSYKEPVSF